VKLKQQIENLENEQKNLTTKATVHQHQTFTTNFIDSDEIVKDCKKNQERCKRFVRNGPTQNKKKGNAVEETNSEDEISNLTLRQILDHAGRIQKVTKYQ
jgi:BRCT domain type II-containing protein